MDFVGNFHKFPFRQLYRVKLYYIDILNLGLISDNTHSYKESILNTLSPYLWCALYKPSDLMGLVLTALTVC